MALPLNLVIERLQLLIEELLEECPSILQIVLYGSYARGEARSKSDIDLLLVFDDEESVEKCMNMFSDKAYEHNLPIIQPYSVTVEEAKRSGVYRKALEEGLVLYHSYRCEPLKTLPPNYTYIILLKYSGPKSKLRKLTGVTVVKNGHKWRARGLLEKMGAVKLAPRLALVPCDRWPLLEWHLIDLGIEYTAIKILASKQQLDKLLQTGLGGDKV